VLYHTEVPASKGHLGGTSPSMFAHDSKGQTDRSVTQALCLYICLNVYTFVYASLLMCIHLFTLHSSYPTM